MIMYLNANWQEGDGGELVIYKENETVKIAPSLGRMVFLIVENTNMRSCQPVLLG